MKTLIMCAGLGTRLKPLTIPKPLVNIGDKTSLEWLLLQLKYNNINEIIINVFNQADLVQSEFLKLCDKYSLHGTVIIESHLLNTGGGIKNIFKYIDDDELLVINCDILWNNNILNPILDILNNWKKDCEVLLGITNRDNFSNYTKKGDYNLNGKRRHTDEEVSHVFTGIRIVKRCLFDDLDEACIIKYFDRAENKNTLKIIDLNYKFWPLDTIHDIEIYKSFH